MRPMSATPHDREAIFKALERALESNSQVLTWTPLELADDLQFYLYEAGKMDFGDLVALCQEWLGSKKPNDSTG